MSDTCAIYVDGIKMYIILCSNGRYALIGAVENVRRICHSNCDFDTANNVRSGVVRRLQKILRAP